MLIQEVGTLLGKFFAAGDVWVVPGGCRHVSGWWLAGFASGGWAMMEKDDCLRSCIFLIFNCWIGDKYTTEHARQRDMLDWIC